MEDNLEKAKKRVNAKKGFLIHAVVAVGVILFFFLVNLYSFSKNGNWWVIYPILLFGIPLLIHGAALSMFPSVTNWYKRWEHKELAKEYGKIQREHQKELTSSEVEEEELDLNEIIKLREQDKLKKE